MALPIVTTADIAYLESQPRSEARDNLMRLAYHVLRRQPKPRPTQDHGGKGESGETGRPKRESGGLKTLVRKLDRVFSEWVRLRDSDDQGYCRCITCGSLAYWREMHNGHFQGRRDYPTRWDTRNCHAQCESCNSFHEGYKERYAREIDKRYGEGTAAILEAKAKTTWTRDTFFLKQAYIAYAEEVQILKAKKGAP